MAPVRPLVYKDGLVQQLASPDVFSHPVYTFATLPTLGASEYGLAFCSNYPGLGGCEVFWAGNYWRPINKPTLAPVYRTGGGFSVTGASNSSASSTVSMPLNTLRAWPFLVDHRFTTNRVQFEVTAAGAGGLVNLALYYANPLDGTPAEQIPNTVGTNMPGDTVAAAVTQALSNGVVHPGHIWLVMVVSATMSFRSHGVSGVPNWLGYNLAGGANNHYTGYSRSFTFAPLPTLNPLATGTVMVNVLMPIVQYRVA